MHAQRHRLEVARRRLLLQLVEVLAGHLEQVPALIERNPAFDRHAVHVLVRRDEIELLGRLRLHDIERVAGRTGFVNEQHAGRALLHPDFVLVGPAPVVRHRPAAERLGIEFGGIGRIRDRRIVDQHDERLALDVHVLIVVPGIFRCDHAVADEHQLRVFDLRRVGDMLGPRDHVVFPLEREFLAAFLEDERRGLRRDADERHFLNERSVSVAGFQADLLELIDQVRDRQLFALRTRAAAAVLVRRQRLRVREHRGDIDVGQLADARPLNRGRRSRRRITGWFGLGRRARRDCQRQEDDGRSLGHASILAVVLE